MCCVGRGDQKVAFQRWEWWLGGAEAEKKHAAREKNNNTTTRRGGAGFGGFFGRRQLGTRARHVWGGGRTRGPRSYFLLCREREGGIVALVEKTVGSVAASSSGRGGGGFGVASGGGGDDWKSGWAQPERRASGRGSGLQGKRGLTQRSLWGFEGD